MTMEFEETEQIGKVVLKRIKRDCTDAPVYSDGPVEKELYYRFKNNPNYGKTDGSFKSLSWAHEYHLSPVRHNLLKWYPFNPNGRILEVGAGCGAVTGLFCSKLKSVTALEYSYQRALVTAQRNSKSSNLEVIVGGLQDFECEKKFDYITVIGVLEYAGTFFGGPKPYRSFLAKLGCMLRPDGELLLAIENKIGLKYITGAPEDHTGRVFESIYNYPSSEKIRTFCKKELTDMLHSAGFYGLSWYYPLPDYKMPKVVLSDDIVPGELDSVWELCPARIGSFPRKEVLSEKCFGKTIARAGLFGDFANSFLIVAKGKNVCETVRVLRFEGSNMKRKPEFRTNTQICLDSHEKLLVKSADNRQSVQFIRKIVEREALAKTFFGDCAEVIAGKFNGSSLCYPHLDFPKLVELIAEAINRGDSDFGKSVIDTYVQFIRKLPSQRCIPKEFMSEIGIPSPEISNPVNCLTCAPMDCIPRNIMIEEKRWYIIDHEWTYEFPMPIDFLIYRAVCSLVYDLQVYIQPRVSTERPVVLFSGYRNRHYIPLSWVEIFKSFEVPLKQLPGWAIKFQNTLVSEQQSRTSVRLRSTSKVLTHVEISERKTASVGLYHLFRFLQKMVHYGSRRKRWRTLKRVIHLE